MSVRLDRELFAAESVVFAARSVRDSLDGGDSGLGHAVEHLARLVEQQEQPTPGGRSLGFSGEDQEEDGAEQKPATEADLLNGALLDLEVGNALLAVGVATGEIGDQQPPIPLNHALQRLDGLVGDLRAGDVPDRLAFGANYIDDETSTDATSRDPAAAFARQANSTLDTIASEAAGIMTRVFDRLREFDRQTVVEALQVLGRSLPFQESIGRLITLGLAKIRRALAALTKIVGEERIEQVKGHLEGFFAALEEERPVKAMIDTLVGVGNARIALARALESDIPASQLIRSTTDLYRLGDRFSSDMKATRRILDAVTLGHVLMTPLAWPYTFATAGGAYLLIVAFVIVRGIDYAGSGGTFSRVRGVAEVAADLRQASD